MLLHDKNKLFITASQAIEVKSIPSNVLSHVIHNFWQFLSSVTNPFYRDQHTTQSHISHTRY